MCGVCDTPELWRGAAAGLCRVYARVLVPPNIDKYAYVSASSSVLGQRGCSGWVYLRMYICMPCVVPRVCVRVYAHVLAVALNIFTYTCIHHVLLLK